jgi:murein DD-endopeptidase MepM/ murein hydrolase activator NlpD
VIEYHIVQKGDTLSKIAQVNGTSVRELAKLNDLKDPNLLAIGQEVALVSTVVFGLQLLFLDRARNPISGINYILEFSGKSIKGATGENGLGKKIYTTTAEDRVRIFINRFDGTLKEIGTVISGYRNKLVTILASSVKLEGKTEEHPALKPNEQPNPREKGDPIYDPKAKQPPTDNKKDLGPTTKGEETADGKPVVKVEGDVQYLDEFLDTYVGGEISDKDIKAAALELTCEPGLIYAIAKQESAKSSFFKLGARTVPKILYERHWFRKLTKPDKASPSPWEEKYHDICGPAYHLTKKNKGKEVIDRVTGRFAVLDDIYGSEGTPQYVRLIKAYQLDKNAALQACSWGKFQIMGFNFKSAGFKSVTAFTRAMSLGDGEHMKAFLKFAKSNNTLLKGLQEKNYEKIAEGHNGTSWRTVNPNYASNLERFFKEYKR